MLLTPDQPNTVLPPPLQSSDELLWLILGSQRERQNLAADHFDGKQQAEKRRLDTVKTLSYFEVKPVQPMGGSSVADIVGLGGYAFMRGNEESTTFGSATVYQPYHVRRYDYNVSYWCRSKPRIFGVMLRDLEDAERKATGSNKGAAVAIVVKGSPAYASDLMKGDIIKQFNDTEVLDPDHCRNLVDKHKGREISLAIYRDGTLLSKRVKLQE